MKDQNDYMMFPAPATEALDLFLTSHLQGTHHNKCKDTAGAAAKKSSDKVASKLGDSLRRTSSIIISPCNSSESIDKMKRRGGGHKRNMGGLCNDPFNLADLARATVPVESSVAFPAIEWNSDDDDENNDCGQLDGSGLGIHGPLPNTDASLAAASDEDEDEEGERPSGGGGTTSGKRRPGSGYASHLPRSKSRKLCLSGLTRPSPSNRSFEDATAPAPSLSLVSSSWPETAVEDRSIAADASMALAALMAVAADKESFGRFSPRGSWGQFVANDSPNDVGAKHSRLGGLRLKRTHSCSSSRIHNKQGSSWGPISPRNISDSI